MTQLRSYDDLHAKRPALDVIVRVGFALVLAATTLAAGPFVAAADEPDVTFDVDSTHDAPVEGGVTDCSDEALPCTLRAAVQQSNDQAPGTDVLVNLPAGTYVLVDGQLIVNFDGSVTIQGDGADATVIDGDGNDRHFLVNSDDTLTLHDVTLTAGEPGAFENGGAIHVEQDGHVNILNSTLSDNHAPNNGGAVYSDGGLEIADSVFTDNTADSWGGAVYIDTGATHVTITGSTFERNEAPDQSGGAIYDNGREGLELTASTFRQNFAGNGGVINQNNGTLLEITDSVFDDNTAQQTGGVIRLNTDGTADISSSVFTDNASLDSTGGVIRTTGGTIIVNDSVFERNSAGNDGGALRATGGTITVTGSVLVDNHAEGGDGGAIRASTGEVTVTDSFVAGNTAARDGGALRAASGTITVAGSTLSGNTAGENGGAIRVNTGTITLERSTLSGNTSTTQDGGGIHVDSISGNALVTESTLLGNSAAGDGQQVSTFGTATFARSIIAGHDDGDACVATDIDGEFSSSGYNLGSDDSCGLDEPTDLPDTDPALGDLADNGGPVPPAGPVVDLADHGLPAPTHAVTPDSPARDAAGAVCEATDQRGVDRPQGAACDIGAFELGTTSLSGTVTDAVTGDAVGGAAVTVDGPDEADTTSDAGGDYDLAGLLEGDYTVTVTADDYADASETVTLTADAPTTHNVALDPLPGAITGTVTDAATGNPIEGATVTADGPENAAANTGADGTYTIDDLTVGDYAVTATADGYDDADTDVTVEPNATATADFALAPLVEPGVVRFAGEDRFDTAARLSAASFDPGVDVVYVATGTRFPDALTGGVAAALDGAPILLVTRDTIPAPTVTELERLNAGRIVILGGTAVVSDAVETALAGFTDGEVTRLFGPERFSTAAAVATASFPDGADTVYVGTGLNFPDALAGVPAAAGVPGPLLLVTGATVPDATAAALDDLAPDEIVILGGPAAVSADVAGALGAHAATVSRIQGLDRFETAGNLAAAAFDDADAVDTVFVATGQAFPDALAAGAVAGAIPSPVLLVRTNSIPDPTAAQLERLGPVRIVLMGGTAAVSADVQTQLEGYLD